MKKILAAILVTLMTGSVALADQLKITVDVSATNRTTEIVGADIYANIDGKLTEISADLYSDSGFTFCPCPFTSCSS